MGILAALYERNQSGRGQVIDAAICDGVISLMAAIQGFHGSGSWDGQQRQSNILDGAAHFYDTYQCADGEWVSIGSIEPQFHALLLEKLGMEPLDHSFADQFDKQKWAPLKARITNIIASKTRAEWCRIMEGSDVCFAPVLSMSEAPEYHHNRARGSFVDIEGCLQTAPAPRFSRTPGEIQGPPVAPGANTGEILEELGLDEATIASLRETGAVA